MIDRKQIMNEIREARRKGLKKDLDKCLLSIYSNLAQQEYKELKNKHSLGRSPRKREMNLKTGG